MEPQNFFTTSYSIDTPESSPSLGKNDSATSIPQPIVSTTTGITTGTASAENVKFMSTSDSSALEKDAAPPVTRSFWGVVRQVPSNRLGARHPSKILPNSFSAIDADAVQKPPPEKPILEDRSLSDMGFDCKEVAGWENIMQPPKEDLYDRLRNMVNNHIKPNVQIRIGSVTFNCHMMVLQCYSDFFMDCTNEVLIQLPEEKVTAGAFMMIYDWMLADQPMVQREGILELFTAANFLRINSLINQCWLCLDDDVRFREDTAFMLYMEARQYNLDAVEQLMLTRICKFFLTLVSSTDFLLLNPIEVCTLLSSNTIGVNSEIEIFLSMVRWMNYDWAVREQYLPLLITSVRFTLMPPWFLVTLNKATKCPEVDRITDKAEVKRLISDGISYTTTQMVYGEHREEFLAFLERYELSVPMQRQWIFDKACKYHHGIDCGNMQHVTYQSFLEYLDMIQKLGKAYWQSLTFANNNEICCSRNTSGPQMDARIPSKASQ